MKRREGGRKSRVGTIFHGALSRPLPLLARARLILPGEAEDKGGTREKEKKKKGEKESSMTISWRDLFFSSGGREPPWKNCIIVECFDSLAR